MSKLYGQLGPQGRRLLGNGPVASYANASPQELDFLIDELRNPRGDTNVNKVLGYMYHYLPYIKQEHNLRLLIASFLNNPVCFSTSTSIFESYSIIEVFKLITDKKLKVSQPTLSIKSYYQIILKELTNFVNYDQLSNSWKVIPIISGMLLSNDVRDQLYTEANVVEYKWFFGDWDKKIHKLFSNCLNSTISPSQSVNINYLSLLSLSITFDKKNHIKSYTKHVSTEFIIDQLVDFLFYSPHSTNSYQEFFYTNDDPGSLQVIMQKPVIRYMNKLSFLLEAYLEKLPYNSASFELISKITSKILNFNRELNHKTAQSCFNDKNSSSKTSAKHQQYWILMKLILFAEIIVFQGILTRFLKSNRGFWVKRPNAYLISQYQQIGLLILHNLYYLNFILLSIGQGGFDSYNFVYYLSIELSIQKSKNYEDLSMFLIGNYQEINLNPEIVNNNYITQSKILFVFGLWENYLQNKIPNESYKLKLFEITFGLADSNRYNVYDIIEGAHSVLLVYFSQAKIDNIPACIKYVEMLFDQHPRSLSANQLSIAVETIGKHILGAPIIYHNSPFENSAHEFLDFLFLKCANTPSLPIKELQGSSNSAIGSAQPISEISAPSTLSIMDEEVKSSQFHNIVDENNSERPMNHIVDDMTNKITNDVKDKLQIESDKYSKYFPTPPKHEYEFEHRLTANTTREAAISTIINLIPYLPLSWFKPNLDKIWILIQNSKSDEQQYLIHLLWKVISENLDFNRSELGYEWWYEEKLLPSTEVAKL